MPYEVTKIEVWAGDLPNHPGTLAQRLEAFAKAGANLEFVIARRKSEDTSRAFFAPVRGKKQQQAAIDLGVQKAVGLHALRIEGPDKPGLGACLTKSLGDAGINLRGLSAASLGKRSVCYVAFATAEEAKRAGRILQKTLNGR